MNDTRRNVLLAGAAVIAGTSLGGASSCSTSTGGIDPELLDKINQVIAGSCNAIGMAAPIAAIVLALFPGLTAAAATVAQISQIAEAFCSAINKPPAQAGKFMAKAGSTDVEVHGWVVKDNKITQF